MSSTRLIAGAALLVVVLAGGYWLMRGQGDGPAGNVTFDATAVDRGNIARTVTASGRVEALVTVEVGSQLSGQIQEIYVDFNDVVTEGQLLALLDPQTFEMRVVSSEADLSVAKSNVLVQEANVTKAQALLNQARREKERQQALAQRGNVSQAVLDNAETAVATAESDLAIAQSQLENARSNVQQREATLAQATIDLDRTQIRSPIDGVVILRNVDVGQTVAASLQAPVLFTIAQDLSKIQIEASVNEADVGGILAGNPVRFSVDAFPERPFQGEVKQVRLAPTELQNVVTYTVIVEATNPSQRLFPGMTATAEIITGERENVLRLPNQALRFWPPGVERPDRMARMRGMMTGLMAVINAELDLTEEQQNQLREAQEARRAQRGGGGGRGQGGGRPRGGQGGGGFDPARIRGFIVDRIKRQLDPILTDAQKTRFGEIEEALREGDVATVWVKGSGAPDRRTVLTGLSDGRFVEVMAGALEEGEEVITRAVETARGN